MRPTTFKDLKVRDQFRLDGRRYWKASATTAAMEPDELLCCIALECEVERLPDEPAGFDFGEGLFLALARARKAHAAADMELTKAKAAYRAYLIRSGLTDLLPAT